ncbi:P-loop containing nucleoside triphosphate hydrolase protein, partial [Dimargaris cristalligena]
KDVEPLAAIDHSSIAYIPIEKNFYQEHPDVSRLNDAEVSQLRRDLDISVRGAGVPRLGLSFAHFGLDTDLLDGIAAHGYREPTTIQKQAIPTALTGRDIIGIAQTGSGKTAAFILPLLVHLLDQPELEPGEGPIGLILAPTRELVQQIHREARQFAGVYGGGAVRCRMAYGGTSRMVQFRELRHSTVDILVATPGRLIDLVKMKATSLRRVSYLVLDEADRMLDLGFEPQVRSICERIRPDRQTLLFSATFPRKIDHLARQITRDPVRIAIGQIGEANSDIRQHFHILPDDTAKWEWLRVHITPYCIEGSVLIFVARMGEVDILAEGLHAMGIECGTIHGGMMQSERDRVIRDFKNDKLSVVVATDVAARGLDIKSIRTVINYDPARDIDSHVHRIGRTGRAGIKGDAHTLLSAKESKAAGDLVRLLESAGDSVPTEVMSLAMQNPKFRQSRDWTSHRGRRGGGRGGRGGRGRG